MRSIAYIASEKVDRTDWENFHEFLRGYTDIFAENVIQTYKEVKTLIHNKDVVILKGDKDSSILIMNKTNYIKKIETMIEEGIKNGTYAETDDTTMQDLKRFKIFYGEIFKSMNITMKCILKEMSRQKCMARLYGENVVSLLQGLWNQCKKLWNKQGTFSFSTVNSSIRTKIRVNGLYNIITHIDDLKDIFPDEDFTMS